MIYRHSKDPTIAAAKSGFSRATGYRIEHDPRLPSQKAIAACRKRPLSQTPDVSEATLPRDNQGETATSIRMRMRWGWTAVARA